MYVYVRYQLPGLMLRLGKPHIRVYMPDRSLHAADRCRLLNATPVQPCLKVEKRHNRLGLLQGCRSATHKNFHAGLFPKFKTESLGFH